jgi:hypothetical protein
MTTIGIVRRVEGTGTVERGVSRTGGVIMRKGSIRKRERREDIGGTFCEESDRAIVMIFFEHFPSGGFVTKG